MSTTMITRREGLMAVVTILALIGLTSWLGASSRVADTMTYQGRLTDSIGIPVDGEVSLTLSLYHVPEGDSPLWTESHATVEVVEGIFTVFLGAVVPIPEEVLEVEELWLGVAVGVDPELAPRQQLTSVAFAVRAEEAEAVVEGGVTGDMIAEATITFDKLDPVCGEGEILIMTGSGWACSEPPCDSQPEVCDGVDNDCNGQVDEGFPGLGDTCEEGIGECRRVGHNQCTVDGMGVECNVTAGDPTDDICDGVDNNCDGTIDDPLTDAIACTNQNGVCNGSMRWCGGAVGYLPCGPAEFGQFYEPIEISCDALDNDCDGIPDNGLSPPPCTNQGGVCYGSVASCGGSAGWAPCTAADYGPWFEATEVTCDGLDNDCDGVVDDPFRAGGVYGLDTHCGNCATDCTTIYARPNAFGVCNTMGPPTCAMTCCNVATSGHGCDGLFDYFDLNWIPNDGCEFQLRGDAIYVSADDPGASDLGDCGLGPEGTSGGGPPHYPCGSIDRGMERAFVTGRDTVVVASGRYEEQIELRDGQSLIGGHHPVTWAYDPHVNRSLIIGPAGSGHRKAVVGNGITATTLFQGFEVIGANASTPGANSYGIYIEDSSSGLVIDSNIVQAGAGAPGMVGANGVLGADGPGGSIGAVTYNTNCSPAGAPMSPGGPGGQSQCQDPSTYPPGGGDDVFTSTSGGDGGSSVCPDRYVQEGSGETGDNGGGSGGPGGWGHDSSSGSCSPTPGAPEAGTPGASASDGADGSGAVGCSTPDGTLENGEWMAGAGSDGGHGVHGAGGGGAGAGGGQFLGTGGEDIGGSGGGAGAGGCAGEGGFGAGGGGASFGLFVVFSPLNLPTQPEDIPSITNNRVNRGLGATGGDGGWGGAGGTGGAGGLGGVVDGYSGPIYCVFPGADGGAGSRGGHGGGGGGGCGGVSFDIAVWNLNSVAQSYQANNTFPIGGGTNTGANGGTGGLSLNTATGFGQAGASGSFGNVLLKD